MSSYRKETKHPKTGKWEKALWLDDCFGNHNYGVVFPSDEARANPRTQVMSDIAFDPREHNMETKEGIISSKWCGIEENHPHAVNRTPFPSDGSKAHKTTEICVKSKMKKIIDVSEDGKRIETIEQASGRKDVSIGVGTLDVKDDDPATKKAKEHIEDTVIKELANRVVTAVLIHKPTNISTATKIKLPRVHEWAEFAMDTLKSGAIRGAKREEFVVVQVEHATGNAKVTTL